MISSFQREVFAANIVEPIGKSIEEIEIRYDILQKIIFVANVWT
jgi:hypothetical protein